MGRLTRGIIGKKPSTTGVTTYSDVFGLDTQFDEQVTGSWPTSAAPGNVKFVGLYGAGWDLTGYGFITFQKMPNGLYYPGQPVDTIPDLTINTAFLSSGANSCAASPGAQYIAITNYTTSTGKSLFVYKRVPNYKTEYQQLTILIVGSGSSYPWQTAFNPAGTILAVGFAGTAGGGYTTGTKFTAYSRSGDTFTQIGGIEDAYSATNSYVVHIAWNRQGTSVAVVVQVQGITNSLIVYNVNGNTFTKLPALPGMLAYSTYGVIVETVWNHDGSSLAVRWHNGSGTNYETIVIYNRNGDTFTTVASPPTLPIPTGSGTGQSMDWNHDGTLFAIGCGASPYLLVYSRSGDTFTSLSVPTIYFGAGGTGLTTAKFTADGAELVISGSHHTEILDVNGTSITRPTTWKFGSLPAGSNGLTMDAIYDGSGSNWTSYLGYILMLK